MGDYFQYATDGPITTITFDRPEKRNGLNPEVMLELEQHVHTVREDQRCRALIVTGNGPSFCAGADRANIERAASDDDRVRAHAEAQRVPRIIGRVFDVLANLDIMTIGAINGHAIGGGWSIALAFDHVIAAEGADFWVPEVELGVPFRGLASVTLTHRLGPVLSKEAAILCRRFSARELAALGVINKVVAPEDLLTEARAVADKVAAFNPRAVMGTKRDINGVLYGTRHF